MENLQNLLKIKEDEIEKLNNIRNTLKRKVIELNDSISLKEMKISSLLEENQELKSTIEEMEGKLSEVNPRFNQKETKNLLPSEFSELPGQMNQLFEKLNIIEQTISKYHHTVQENLQIKEKGISTERNFDTRSPTRPEKNTSVPSYRDRLKPRPNNETVTSDSEQNFTPQKSIAPKTSLSASKSKMIPPIVNIGKVAQNNSRSSPNKIPAPPPSIPSKPPKPPLHQEFEPIPPPTNSQIDPTEYDQEEVSAPKPISSPRSIPTGPEKLEAPSVNAGKYGVPTYPYPSDGLIKCPECGGNNFQEMENRKKIVMFNPRKYGKKYYCRECRANWDYAY